MDHTSGSRSPEPHPVKRRRVALACDPCRTRKSRCDGNRPKCSLCSDLGFDCGYTPSSTATNVIVQKDYLSGLEGRVKTLEDSLLAVRNDLSGLSHRVDQGHDPKVGHDEDVPSGSAMPDLAGTEDSVDGMGTVKLAEEEDSGFFGPSSNVAFLRHLTRGIVNSGTLSGGLENPVLRTGVYEGGFVSASRPPSPRVRRSDRPSERSGEHSIFAVPPRSETLELIHRFFSDTGLLFPYIYPPAFLETYHQVARENFSKVRRTWLGLLNMVLAMSTITTSPGVADADARIAESDVFYQRGLGLCGSEILRGTTVEVVQFLLLMGQYLQGTQKSVQAWTIHGLAVKAALQLGLHSRDASRAFSPVEQETRKRTWYGCVVLDRTLSMTFGRPAAIPDSYVKLELPAAHPDLNTSAVIETETSCLSLSFFNSSIELYKHMWTILDLLYGQNLGCDMPLSVSQTVSQVFAIEQHLFTWEKSLPDALRLINIAGLRNAAHEPSSNTAHFSWKFRTILTLRHLNLRVLLHRPILVKFIDACGGLQPDPQELKLLQQMGPNSLCVCADCAMEIIDLIYDIVYDPGWRRSLLGAWWFSLYYTFNAAFVILGLLWVCRNETVTGQSMAELVDRAQLYPSRAIAALLKLDGGNRMVNPLFLFSSPSLVAPRRQKASSDPTLGPSFGLYNTASLAPSSDFNFSPLGMEFGEFMVDGDLLALLNRE
ncbi:hypothetical protein P168DRAFT_311552 [Aspergillus campestris IBT 28561]|uniref:Zn(2)-C6 fungal-type domain-containing protein n=1 Tax=Aspergillus campestris (strain IBT 28561) TaxID=1392248 RepID=A0A2I1CZE2_ASPC2|nr:uncharacterized protein P168DRAFT_311552 [Aspergillus campestris IBT 28561]PKY03000.1 hypothetical protein P168DRAFT_311552 [Aspergillus campestris IBT 28561]